MGCTGCWWENLRERCRWGDPDVDGRIILRWMFRKLEGGRGDWMELAQDRDRWRALVSTVKNLQFKKIPSNTAKNRTTCGFVSTFYYKGDMFRLNCHLQANIYKTP
jgi:hypothetical protein